MRSVILDAFENENPIGNTLKRLLEEKNIKLSYFKLKDMNILPCRSCGSCGLKTPGKCVINDEMPLVMKAIATSSIYIMLTPIRFGGYCSELKKAVDRTMSMGLPFYIVKNGHLLHSMRYGDKALLCIGLAEENLREQEENFRTLVARNALNMSFSYSKALIFRPSDDTTGIAIAIDNVLREVNKG